MDQIKFIEELISHEHASEMGSQIETLFTDCLFKENELANGQPLNGITPVVAEGIMETVGFHPERIAAARRMVVSQPV